MELGNYSFVECRPDHAINVLEFAEKKKIHYQAKTLFLDIAHYRDGKNSDWEQY